MVAMVAMVASRPLSGNNPRLFSNKGRLFSNNPALLHNNLPLLHNNQSLIFKYTGEPTLISMLQTK